MKCVAILSSVLSVLVLVNGQDWCNMQGCTVNTHIACNNNGLFASTCVNPINYVLTTAQIQRILDGLNLNRNQVATGSLSPFPPAIRMAKMKWNNETAKLAELNTKQCTMKHDKCRNTNSFRFAGQNLALRMTTGSYTVEKVIDMSLSSWFDEYKRANVANIKTVGSPSNGVIGHFTAMVTERSTEVGCAISSYTANGWNTYLMACNYASTNMLGCSVYRSGPVASACTSGTDSTYPGLCSIYEPINPNSIIC